MLAHAQQVAARGDHLQHDQRQHQAGDPAEAAERVDPAHDGGEDGDQQVGLGVAGAGRVEAGQHQAGGDEAQHAGQRVDADQHAPGVDAGIARGLQVRAQHVDRDAERGPGQDQADRDRRQDQHQERHGHAPEHAVAQPLERLGQARDDRAAGEPDRDAVDHRLGAQGHQDRMDAHGGDEKARDQADRGAQDQAGQQGRRDHQRRLRPAGAHRQPGRHDPGHQQRALVGRGDDGEVEAARDQRDHHGQRQEPQLRQLEHHRLQRAEGGEPAGQQDREQQYQRHQQAHEPARIARQAATGQAGEEVPVQGRGTPHQAVTGVRRSRRRARADSPVIEVETRITSPITIWKK